MLLNSLTLRLIIPSPSSTWGNYAMPTTLTPGFIDSSTWSFSCFSPCQQFFRTSTKQTARQISTKSRVPGLYRGIWTTIRRGFGGCAAYFMQVSFETQTRSQLQLIVRGYLSAFLRICREERYAAECFSRSDHIALGSGYTSRNLCD